MALYLDYERKKKRNWFILGCSVGVLTASTLFFIYQGIQPIPRDTLCKKEILFEQITPNGSVYLKTKQQCMDIHVIK